MFRAACFLLSVFFFLFFSQRCRWCVLFQRTIFSVHQRGKRPQIPSREQVNSANGERANTFEQLWIRSPIIAVRQTSFSLPRFCATSNNVYDARWTYQTIPLPTETEMHSCKFNLLLQRTQWFTCVECTRDFDTRWVANNLEILWTVLGIMMSCAENESRPLWKHFKNGNDNSRRFI